MDDLVARRRIPFAITAVVVSIATLAIFRLPELYVSQLRRNAVLEDARGTWAFRLLLVTAIGQAAYGGYRVLRSDRIVEVEGDRIASSDHREKLISTIAWVAAGLIGLTLVYAVATFALTGLRAGSWAFVVVMLAQGVWYYRLTGELAAWVERRPMTPSRQAAAWDRGDATYTPPLARGLSRPTAGGRTA